MKTFFGTLLHRLSASNKEHILWFGVVVIVMITLAVLHHRWKDDDKKIRLWRFLCLLPLIVSAVHALIYLRGFTQFAGAYFPIYFTALFALLPIPFAKRKIGYQITAVMTGLVACVLGFVFLGMSPMYFNHTQESYTESFHSLVQDMDRYYILKEWKQIDFGVLEEKYMNMLNDANKARENETIVQKKAHNFYEASDIYYYSQVKGLLGFFVTNSKQIQTALNTEAEELTDKFNKLNLPGDTKIFIDKNKVDARPDEKIEAKPYIPCPELSNKTKVNVKGQDSGDFDLKCEVVNEFKQYLKNIGNFNADEEKKKTDWQFVDELDKDKRRKLIYDVVLAYDFWFKGGK